jgi:hypothetical protein
VGGVLAKIIDFKASKAGSKKKNLEFIEITQIYTQKIHKFTQNK